MSVDGGGCLSTCDFPEVICNALQSTTSSSFVNFTTFHSKSFKYLIACSLAAGGRDGRQHSSVNRCPMKGRYVEIGSVLGSLTGNTCQTELRSGCNHPERIDVTSTCNSHGQGDCSNAFYYTALEVTGLYLITMIVSRFVD